MHVDSASAKRVHVIVSWSELPEGVIQDMMAALYREPKRIGRKKWRYPFQKSA
jgi:hypothetical protein